MLEKVFGILSLLFILVGITFTLAENESVNTPHEITQDIYEAQSADQINSGLIPINEDSQTEAGLAQFVYLGKHN